MITTYRLEIAYALIGAIVLISAVAVPMQVSRRRRERRRRLGVKDYNA
ncbi:hypothetical protein BH09PSE4_BH09PSE4_12260 [soil metagenome]